MRRSEAITAYAFLAPTLLGFTAFTLGPIIASGALAFFEWDLFSAPTFSGDANFRRLAADPLIWKTITNTAVFAVGAEGLNICVGLLIAVGLNRLRRHRSSAIMRSAYFLPFLMSTAVVAVLWKVLLSRDTGVVNWSLGLVGLGPVSWLSSTWAMPTIILLDVWKNIGFFVVIFLAGLQTIPDDLYEAAKVDGARGRHTFRYVTLPMLSGTVFFVAVVAVIGASQVFDSVFVLTNGGPGDATRTIVMYLYEQGFSNFRFGYASVIALLVFAIVFALSLIQFRLSRRWVYER